MPYLNIPAFIEVIRRLCLAENAASSFDVVLMGVIILYSMTTIVLILEHLLSGCTHGDYNLKEQTICLIKLSIFEVVPLARGDVQNVCCDSWGQVTRRIVRTTVS